MTGFRNPGRNPELITVTADVTLTAADAGKIVCNVGAAGAVIVTLPSAAACRVGDQIMVLSCADQDLTCSFTAGQLITLNDVAANSVALSTASEKAGGGFIFTCVSGSKWHCLPLLMADAGGVTQTATVAT